jgi:hypothetical protein
MQLPNCIAQAQAHTHTHTRTHARTHTLAKEKVKTRKKRSQLSTFPNKQALQEQPTAWRARRRCSGRTYRHAALFQNYGRGDAAHMHARTHKNTPTSCTLYATTQQLCTGTGTHENTNTQKLTNKHTRAHAYTHKDTLVTKHTRKTREE